MVRPGFPPVWGPRDIALPTLRAGLAAILSWSAPLWGHIPEAALAGDISLITYSNSKSSVGLPLGTRFGTSVFRCLGRMRGPSRPWRTKSTSWENSCVGELDRRLEQRVETRQYWLDRAQRSLQVWRKITRCVMARRGRGVQMVADGVCEVDKSAVMYERRHHRGATPRWSPK